ncbi:MAG: hypothetical protein RLZZ383_3010, partial [Pseudomonadota bacterium]
MCVDTDACDTFDAPGRLEPVTGAALAGAGAALDPTAGFGATVGASAAGGRAVSGAE